jgi:tRNA(fMet)-specific endonuclease VapC
MRYLIDTNVVSDFVRGEPSVSLKLKATEPEQVVVSSITVMEIEYGLRLAPRRARALEPILRDILRSVHVVSFSRRDALAAAGVRAALRETGTPIGPYDVLLAGTALHRGLTFVTTNTSEFARVSGLTVENWRAP